ncbi:helix-turn-helix domain-containing protein [Neisseria sp. DTU_2020_1000833_1_SI_GRL_NUU_006]|jgi:toxin-antitoxin system, antitoxin component, xre family|uniref:DNA binding domain, excisionase family n=1 Tax=Neisseria mucosa (strain ATCC 25996 / DSM 4631 / NCTC 10774 / M26) TaxID=546266 RepID=D2ZT34_NEIM2|nr:MULTISPECIES: helix-turn-helix domain-containing protein [Neisseria]EFC89967.1 DNA binding domain, excisionase family [Neisseria mucosa ATCC 25996]MBS5835533.1 helix-turn-helix domain-containing protein [Neisseria sp.]WNU96910.1 helix-turn-helix domain-containing protein [Neisseria sp. DTU_2020_1000833_1_SI_GRL_NUU_006]VTX54721.1 Helix-turn-helix domain protein [Neisseria sicca]
MKTYNVEEAAAYCKCHPETIREHIRDGRLNASKPGRRYCITQAALDVFLNGLENDAVQASLESRSEEKCQSIKETTHGMWMSSRQAANALDARLARHAKPKPKSTMTN